MKKIPLSTLRSQRGYLAIIAVFIIIAVGFMAMAATYMFVGSGVAGGDMQQSDNAFYIAESGLEESNRALLTPFLTGSNKRISCNNLTGTASITNTSFGSGKFTATAIGGAPIYALTTLNGALTAVATTVPVASTASLSPTGVIMVDQEEIAYNAISGNSLTAVTRGFRSSVATNHATGAHVAQYQCDLDVIGGTPNLTSPISKRELQQDISLQEAWAVGNLSGSTFVFTRWNMPTELTWTASTVTAGTAEILNGVSMLSNAEGWAVGNIHNTTFTLLHWLGTSWAATTAPAATCNTQNLNAVFAVSSQEAWAVGAKYLTTACAVGNNGYTMLKWNGTAWTVLSNSTTPSIPAASSSTQNLNAVYVISTTGANTGNLGFAVGDSGLILQFNGSTWTKVTSPTTQNLEGVYVVSATQAWAVGAAGVILKWNGTSWALVTSPTTTQLNAIAMLDATHAGTAQAGWAVGNSGVAVTYNGTSWSSQNTGNANTLNGVALFYNANDVWAAGNAGTLLHWDGSAWTSFSSGTTLALNAISSVVRQPVPSAWQEIFP